MPCPWFFSTKALTYDLRHNPLCMQLWRAWKIQISPNLKSWRIIHIQPLLDMRYLHVSSDQESSKPLLSCLHSDIFHRDPAEQNLSGRAWWEVREVEQQQQQQLPANEDSSSSSNEKSSQESHLLPPSPSSMPPRSNLLVKCTDPKNGQLLLKTHRCSSSPPSIQAAQPDNKLPS